MMSSSLPHVTSNHVSYNGLYGVAVFSQKDGSGESPGGHGAQENFGEDGDATLWETELEKDDDLLRRPITAALVESNTVNHNGGECPSPQPLLQGLLCSACPKALPASSATSFSHLPGTPASWTSRAPDVNPFFSVPTHPTLPFSCCFSCLKFPFSHPHAPNNSHLGAHCKFALTLCPSLL